MSFYSLILAAGNAVAQNAPAVAPAAAPAVQTVVNAAPVAQTVVDAAPAAQTAADAAPAVQTVVNAAPAAQTAVQNAPEGSNLMSFLPIILLMVFLFFFLMRGPKKQQQKRQQMLDTIVKGTEVILASGICGKIDSVLADAYIVEIASNIKIKVTKAGIADVIVKQEETAAKKEETK